MIGIFCRSSWLTGRPWQPPKRAWGHRSLRSEPTTSWLLAMEMLHRLFDSTHFQEYARQLRQCSRHKTISSWMLW